MQIQHQDLPLAGAASKFMEWCWKAVVEERDIEYSDIQVKLDDLGLLEALPLAGGETEEDEKYRLRKVSAVIDYPECSGAPESCPENEGYGCCDKYNDKKQPKKVLLKATILVKNRHNSLPILAENEEAGTYLIRPGEEKAFFLWESTRIWLNRVGNKTERDPFTAGFLRGEIAELKEKILWKTSETAPKDGTHILVCRIGKSFRDFNERPPMVVHYWDNPGEEGFYLSNGNQDNPIEFTHWTLPTPPQQSEQI